MSFMMDDIGAGGQVLIGAGRPTALGVGPSKIRGSTFVEGPLQTGAAGEYGSPQATLMVGKLQNSDTVSPLYSLWCKTYARFQSFVKIDTLLKVKNIEARLVRTKILQASIKNFVIDHPTIQGKKLVHTCLEGPENGVYYRGRLLNRDEIHLPDYWRGLVDAQTITVSITPIGAFQDIIVKRVVDNVVHLQARPGVPINCYYHVFAERKDVPKLVTEINA